MTENEYKTIDDFNRKWLKPGWYVPRGSRLGDFINDRPAAPPAAPPAAQPNITIEPKYGTGFNWTGKNAGTWADYPRPKRKKGDRYPAGTPWWSYPAPPEDFGGTQEEWAEETEYVDSTGSFETINQEKLRLPRSYQDPAYRQHQRNAMDKIDSLDEEIAHLKTLKPRSSAIAPGATMRGLDPEGTLTQGTYRRRLADLNRQRREYSEEEPNLVSIDGSSWEEVPEEDMSYEIEEEKVEVKRPTKKKVKTPASLTDEPEVIFQQSRETGEPWQDIIIDSYISKNPWLDQHKVRKAVYGIADKHFDKWLKDNKGNPAGYDNHLKQSLSKKKGGYGKGKGKKDKKKSLATSILKGNQKLSRYINVLQKAQKFTGEVHDKELGSFMQEVGVGKDNKIDTTVDMNEVFKDAGAKRHAAGDAYVNAQLSGLSTEEEDQKPKFNRWGVQRDSQIMIGEELVKRYNAKDPEVTEFVMGFASGQKPGTKAFKAAASDIFLRYGVDDLAESRGKRGTKRIKSKKSEGYDPDRKRYH